MATRVFTLTWWVFPDAAENNPQRTQRATFLHATHRCQFCFPDSPSPTLKCSVVSLDVVQILQIHKLHDSRQGKQCTKWGDLPFLDPWDWKHIENSQMWKTYGTIPFILGALAKRFPWCSGKLCASRHRYQRVQNRCPGYRYRPAWLREKHLCCACEGQGAAATGSA